MIETDGYRYYFASQPRPENLISISTKNRKNSISGSLVFWGQTSPQKMIEAYSVIKSGITDYNQLRHMGYRNALELLSVTNGCRRIAGSIVLQRDIIEILNHIDNTLTIKYVKNLLISNPSIKSIEVGEALNSEFERNWTQSSKLRYGNALLRWTKYIKENL